MYKKEDIKDAYCIKDSTNYKSFGYATIEKNTQQNLKEKNNNKYSQGNNNLDKSEINNIIINIIKVCNHNLQ